ncbi:MAG: phosphatidate phosphatase App1 family protein [Phycisphaerales bacterium]
MKDDEVVRLYPTLASWTDDGALIAPVHGRIYEPEHDSLVREWAFEVIEELFEEEEGVPERLEEAAQDRLHARLALFAADDERGKRLRVRVGEQTILTGPSTAQGRFRGSARIDGERARTLRNDAPAVFHVELSPKHDRARAHDAAVYVPAPPGAGGTGGVAVVCDLDDTVKVSNVRDEHALFRSTFWEEWRAVDGAPDLVRAIADATDATTIYLTAARWPLLGEFRDFLDQVGCPPGVFVMREFDFSLRDFRFTREGAEEHKRGALRELAAALPTHDFVLIGDSTEADPVVYGEFARAHPDRVRAVLVRLVGEDRADDPRFAEAFAGVDQARVILFAKPPAFPAVESLVTTPAQE